MAVAHGLQAALLLSLAIRFPGLLDSCSPRRFIVLHAARLFNPICVHILQLHACLGASRDVHVPQSDRQSSSEAQQECENADGDSTSPRHRRRAPASPLHSTAHGLRSSASGKLEEREAGHQELLCVCQQANHADTAMVGCDACGEWYHLRCMGLTQNAARSLKRWSCPLCYVLRGAGTPLQDALHRTRRTRCEAVSVPAEGMHGAVMAAFDLMWDALP